jgi:hypothetical protein
VVLATVSPYLRKMFGSGMADSKSREIELQDVGELALPPLVEFAYTGKLELKGSTVVAIIRAANRLQMEAVERAAVDFLGGGLDAGNVLDAMALGAHLEAGVIGRQLRDKSRSWLSTNFHLVAAEPSFLQLPVAALVPLVESDDLGAKEEDVFAAVLAWVKEDEAGRKAELDRLLPLVRFPLMPKPGLLIMAEPLLARHPLMLQLLFETHPDFVESDQAAACPRLRPRKGFTRTFTVGGGAVAFAVALFGPAMAVLAPTAAVPAAPLLADAELTNAGNLRGRVAVEQRRNDEIPFFARAWRAQQAGAVAVVIVENESDLPMAFAGADETHTDDERVQCAAIAIPVVSVGKADGKLLLLGGAAVVALAYDRPAAVARGRPQAAAQAKRAVQAAGGGIAISGLPASLADYNTTYAPAEASAGGYPGYASAAGHHLCYAASHDQWVLDSKRFDPADNTCVAGVDAVGGPVPTGSRVWIVHSGGKLVQRKVAAREVA